MSMYSDYLYERTNDQIIETEDGFATFRYVNNFDTVYLIDIYVKPESRQKKIATGFADQIAAEAKEKGAKEMIGTVVPSAKNSTISLKVLVGYGMTLHQAGNDVIVFRKDL